MSGKVCQNCLGIDPASCWYCGSAIARRMTRMDDQLLDQDRRIRNLRALLARERLFRRQWQEEARRNYYRLQPRP
jgi:hypothetical protein